jgi:hypothetical protein
MSELLRRLQFTGPPSRAPGRGEVGLEPVSGDIQLKPPKQLQLRAGKAKATERERQTLWEPTKQAPVSGVYDLVDDYGNYLGSQITCHEGDDFPVTQSSRARALDEVVVGADGKKNTVHHYRYRLAHEAIHLGPPLSPVNETIYRPGEVIPTSGVYNVVDRDGEYLLHQRACIHNRSGPGKTPNKFPETEDSNAYGYRLEYPAEHLSDD